MSYKKLRVGRYGGVDVIEFRMQERGSLKGQMLKHFINNYPTKEAAMAAHPDAEGWSNGYTDPSPNLNHLPDENDPVPGGMYPDDI